MSATVDPPPTPVSMDLPGVSPVTPSEPLVDELGVTCGDGAVFSAGRLDDEGRAHLGDAPLTQTLRGFLASRDGALSGAPSWVLVELTDQHAQFLGRQAPDRWSFVRFARRDGAWRLDFHGDCVPRVAIEQAQFAVEWTLDGTTRELSGGSSLGLLLDTVPCDPGNPVLEDLEAPLVAMREDRIEVAILAREDTALEYCTGPIPFRIDLPERDLQRPVYDGATYPPRLVDLPSGS